MSDEVTLDEVLAEQQILERTARKRFPFDPIACTLYMDIPPRQILFTCLTCRPSNALCYSCGIRCHSSHEIVELYSKREFECDCGTSRFPASGHHKCELRQTENDDWANRFLQYGHNFNGTFCTCKESVKDESYGDSAMFQCLVGTKCNEDWFHARCIVGISRAEEVKRQTTDWRANEETNNENNEMKTESNELTEETTEVDDDIDEEEEDSGDELDATFPELPSEFGAIICPQCMEDVALLRDSEAVLATVNEYVFLKSEYGSIISDAPELAPLLLRFPFLNGNEESYTPEKDEDNSTLLEAGERVLQTLPRDAVVHELKKFNAMQTNLVEYVKLIAESGRAVTREDVEAFFAAQKVLDK